MLSKARSVIVTKRVEPRVQMDSLFGRGKRIKGGSRPLSIRPMAERRAVWPRLQSRFDPQIYMCAPPLGYIGASTKRLEVVCIRGSIGGGDGAGSLLLSVRDRLTAEATQFEESGVLCIRGSIGGGDAARGRVWVVPYSFHLSMMELTVLLRTFNTLEIVLYTSPDRYAWCWLNGEGGGLWIQGS